MTYKVSRRRFLKATGVVGGSLLLASSPTVYAQPSTYDREVRDLAEHYFTAVPEQEGLDLFKRYRALNFQQMEALNNELVQVAKTRMQGRDDNVDDRLDIAFQMRHELNRQSMQQFNVPFNQLNGNEFNALLEQVWRSGFDSQMNAITASLASCVCLRYPFLTTPGNGGWFSNARTSSRAANNANCNDCDLDCAYDQNTSIIRWVNLSGLAYYTSLGGVFLLRQPSNSSNILIGYGAVTTVFLGSEYLALTSYRLD
ncbi:MAG: twin-arginine translocation signal domain-containing protein [Chloroflexaceae bacterium]|jgi:hypothetical protein|nr:twin-arginine translocation signal domain-containing protein [Chloroflexaceae bacterium]